MLEGRKTFEVRLERPGRLFNVGDMLTFYLDSDKVRTFQRRVAYVLRDMSWYGIPDDVAIMALDPVEPLELYRDMARLGNMASGGRS